ncbi:YfiR family protein [Alkalimonas delamerensis]|uniref:YfiR family protein n=1 Tax=Alkalimonas delamerensis TaxID=265981 RepID=A0ABT9GRA6_9GAMM|nr:YfiR family protein [Alkalimonas delamerensis]MDP4529508.1 YfiR family protein [Alkalimonas delamerensis]
MKAIPQSISVLLLCSIFWLPAPVNADTERLAALLIRFSQYAELPTQSDRARLCVLHDQKMMEPLNRLLPDFSQFEPEALLLTSPDQLRQCHILWSGFPYWPPDEWLGQLHRQPMLWISDHPDLFRRGVLISVHYTPQSMRFRVNLTQARSQQIRFNSRLLQLAHEII